MSRVFETWSSSSSSRSAQTFGDVGILQTSLIRHRTPNDMSENIIRRLIRAAKPLYLRSHLKCPVPRFAHAIIGATLFLGFAGAQV